MRFETTYVVKNFDATSKSQQKKIAQLHRARERQLKQQIKEREKKQKEQAKLSAQRSAEAEVRSFEEVLANLRGAHKKCRPVLDWLTIASSIAPHPPIRTQRGRLKLSMFGLTDIEIAKTEREILIEDEDYSHACERQLQRIEELEDLRTIADGVLMGSLEAYAAVLESFSPFSDMEELGGEVTVLWGDAKSAAFNIALPGRSVVPAEIKSLGTSGKVNSKAMPKTTAYEIYQDFVCSCVLRIAREAFACLPLQIVVITVFVNELSPTSGREEMMAVFTGAIEKAKLEVLDFQKIDPSDAMENFVYRGDLKTSKKTGTFLPVAPFEVGNHLQLRPGSPDLAGLRIRIQSLSANLNSFLRSQNIVQDSDESEQETV